MSRPRASRYQVGVRRGRRIGTGPGLMLALLVLFARIVAAAPMPMTGDADAFSLLAGQAICHAAPDDAGQHVPAPAHSPGHSHDACLLCPACHLLAHAAGPVPAGPVLETPGRVVLGAAAPLPFATGPPGRFRPVPAPTGPPASV